jgi:poly [ADP-ribose] polymerase
VNKADRFDQGLVDFLNYIWSESVGNLDDILDLGDIDSENSAFLNVTLEQLEKAEIILHKQKLALNENKKANYTNEFYGSLPFKPRYKKPLINAYKSLLKCYELCQVLRDIIMIGEETNWNLRTSVQSIYRSIGTFISKIDSNHDDYESLSSLLLDSFDASELKHHSEVEVLSIYEIARPNEQFSFNKSNLDNIKLLFHGSRVENFVGILSRGLLLPKFHNSDGLEIELDRTDIGMLGAGVYFSDSLCTSLKYAHKSNSKQTSLVAVCEVALGKCYDTREYHFDFKQPPQGFDSVHGVKAGDGIVSKFEDSEYCIYDLSQYRIKYLAEIRTKSNEEEMINQSVDRIFLKNENSISSSNKSDEKIDFDELKLKGKAISN